MIKNMGKIDRIIRVIVAIIIAILYFTDVIPGTKGVVLIAISGVFVLTSSIGFCPLYTLFGFSTCPKDK